MYLLQVPLDQLPSPTEVDSSGNISISAKNKGPRACRTCAKAKSRCIPGPSPDKCERCHRLSKPCSSQTPAPPRKRRSPKPTRVSQLERRLEDLTARLDSVSRGQGPTPPDSAGSPASGSSDRAAASQAAIHGPWHSQMPQSMRRPPFGHLFPLEQVGIGLLSKESPIDLASARSDATPPTTVTGRVESISGSEGAPTPPAPALAPATYELKEGERRVCCPFIPQQQHEGEVATPKQTIEELETREPLWPKGQEAEDLLEEYRTQMAPLFPFVVIPAMPSRELRLARPLLWKAVMMEASHLDGARQMELGGALLGELSAAALTAPRKGIDVLQALEVFITWYNYGINSFQTTNLLYLTRSIAHSLKSIESQVATIKGKNHGPQVLEELRAFLGAFYITSLVFASSKKIDGLMNPAMVESCCRVLEDSEALPSDELLVSLVRIQLLAQKISTTMVSLQSSPSISDEDIRNMVKRFEQEIDTYLASLSPTHRENDAITSHVQVARLILYEISLQADQLGVAISAETRMALLWNSLSAAKGFFTNRFAQDIRNQPRFICLNSYEYMYCFLLSLKLITLQAPGWDPRAARKMVNFDEYLDKQISDMLVLAQRRRRRTVLIGNVMDQGGPREGRIDPFDRLAQRLTFLRGTLAKELEGEITRDSSTTSPASAAPAVAESSPLEGELATEAMVVDSGMMPQFDAFQDLNSDAWADMLGPGGWDNYLNMPFSDINDGFF